MQSKLEDIKNYFDMGLFNLLFQNWQKKMKQEINFRILETIEACKSIHALKQEEDNHISIKELKILEEIYG